MGILQYPQVLPGQSGVIGAMKYMATTDNLATITTAGYLNNPDLAVFPIAASDVIGCTYSYNTQTQSGTFGFFTVSISNGVITMAQTSAGGVILPTIANHIATYTNTSGVISEDAATAINGGNIQAGLSGTAGYVASFPGTASKGSLRVTAVANTGNTVTTISNVAMGQASVVSIPDPAAATANFAVAPAALVNNNLIKASGTAGLVADAGIAAANVMSIAAVNTMSAGGQIITDKATATTTGAAATINKQSGVLTTESLTTAGGATYVIALTNSEIASSSIITTSVMGGTNTTQNFRITATPGSGSATITIYNLTAATAFDGTIIFGFVVW